MDLKLNFDYFFNLGFQNIDQNYNWINNLKQRYMNLVDIDTFLNENSSIRIARKKMYWQIIRH